jgi:hypothetical protein
MSIVTGFVGAFAGSPALSETAFVMGGVFYAAVAVLLYLVLRRVHHGVSLLAALFGLTGSVLWILEAMHLSPLPVKSLVFFGAYCLLLGFLIFRSDYMPRWLGWLVVLAGMGWLTYLSPELVKHLGRFVMISGLLGEGGLTLWLLVGPVQRS